MSENDPQNRGMNLIMREFYQVNEYARPVLGSWEDVSKLTPSDLFDFKNTHYCGANCIIAYSGKASLEEVKALLEKDDVTHITVVEKISAHKLNIKMSHIKNTFRSFSYCRKGFRQNFVESFFFKNSVRFYIIRCWTFAKNLFKFIRFCPQLLIR